MIFNYLLNDNFAKSSILGQREAQITQEKEKEGKEKSPYIDCTHFNGSNSHRRWVGPMKIIKWIPNIQTV